MLNAPSESRTFTSTPPHRPTTSKDAPKVHARYKDDSANCKLISSDNVIFYVKRRHLETERCGCSLQTMESRIDLDWS